MDSRAPWAAHAGMVPQILLNVLVPDIVLHETLEIQRRKLPELVSKRSGSLSGVGQCPDTQTQGALAGNIYLALRNACVEVGL